MSYEIDFREMVRRLLPSALRGESTAAFFSVLAHPFQNIHTSFEEYAMGRYGKRWYISHNWTADSMQAMLNEYFADDIEDCGLDPDTQPIKVEDGVEGNEVLLFPRLMDRLVRTTVLVTPGITWRARPFTVLIPEALRNIIDEGKVHRLVRTFKLYGTHYEIVYYQST